MRLGIDVGGTFTDFVLMDPGRRFLGVGKHLTTPADPSLGALDGTAALCKQHGVPLAEVMHAVHGTTLVANTIIERRGRVPASSPPAASAMRWRPGARSATTCTTCSHPKARSALKPGDRLTIRFAGGGYGPPDGRDRDRVLSDLRHGYITERAAREAYKLT